MLGCCSGQLLSLRYVCENNRTNKTKTEIPQTPQTTQIKTKHNCAKRMGRKYEILIRVGIAPRTTLLTRFRWLRVSGRQSFSVLGRCTITHLTQSLMPEIAMSETTGILRSMSRIRYLSLALLASYAVVGGDRVVALGLVWMLAPFIPASNVFFPVATVLGERLLYHPSPQTRTQDDHESDFI